MDVGRENSSRVGCVGRRTGMNPTGKKSHPARLGPDPPLLSLDDSVLRFRSKRNRGRALAIVVVVVAVVVKSVGIL